jgi:hypothetical protein
MYKSLKWFTFGDLVTDISNTEIGIVVDYKVDQYIYEQYCIMVCWSRPGLPRTIHSPGFLIKL